MGNGELQNYDVPAGGRQQQHRCRRSIASKDLSDAQCDVGNHKSPCEHIDGVTQSESCVLTTYIYPSEFACWSYANNDAERATSTSASHKIARVNIRVVDTINEIK